MDTKFGVSMVEEDEEIISEIGGDQNTAPNIRSQVAIRCAKSAILLSSLKHHHFPDSSTLTNDNHEEEEEEEEVELLKKELVKERLKNKKMRSCSFAELFLQIALLFSFWTLSLLIAFNFLY